MSESPNLVYVETKSPWASKVLWVNGLTILAALLMFIVGTQSAGQLPFSLDAKWVAFLLGLVNFALRFVTSAPITGIKP